MSNAIVEPFQSDFANLPVNSPTASNSVAKKKVKRRRKQSNAPAVDASAGNMSNLLEIYQAQATESDGYG